MHFVGFYYKNHKSMFTNTSICSYWLWKFVFKISVTFIQQYKLINFIMMTVSADRHMQLAR